jgi:ribulose-5-phosphate 4-epimerase/fuculose-1-phosphate aldolase
VEQRATAKFTPTTTKCESSARLLADLGDRHILVLRNHGLLIVGTSIGAAFVATYRMERGRSLGGRIRGR